MSKVNPQSACLKAHYLKDYQAPPYLIETVNLEFVLGEEFTQVKSTLVIYANPANVTHANTSKNLELQGNSLELKHIKLDGVLLNDSQYQVTSEMLTIFNVSVRFTLEIETIIKPQENTALTGLYKSNGNFCTQCESHGFQRITYFIDRPDVMARYTTLITADEQRYPVLLSNGNLVATGKSENGQHWAKWEDPFKKPSYLFALVAGDFEYLEDIFMTKSDKKVVLRIYVEKGNLDKCAHAMQSVKNAMQWDEEKYGREYDLDIYMIVAVSDFNMGAMENKGLNIFNTKYILARPETATDQDFIYVEAVVGHEYFHNWTGNRITCRDWFQLSLKEGLTVFRDHSFTADMTSKTVTRIQNVNALRTVQFAEDGGPLAHPVRPESYIEMNNFYTATVYEKGAEVIRMMQTILGEKLFRKGMDLYFERHDGQAVTTDDFVVCMENASGIDLTQFRLWYSQAGTPQLKIQDHYDADKKIYALDIEQTIPDTPGQQNKKPMHIPVKFGLLDNLGNEIVNDLLHVKKTKEQFQFENILSKPVPSLLRGFSAPVKMEYDYSDASLQLLFKHDTDYFNRWEAGYQYATNLMMKLIADYQHGKKLFLPDVFIDGYIYAMQTFSDKLLLTEILTLPSEKYLSQQMKVADPDAIYAVREFVSSEIAKQLKNLFWTTYQKNHVENKPYKFNMVEVGRRQLKNICLHYLMILDDEEVNESFGMRQFKMALKNNMTDTMAALKGLSNIARPERELALNEFYATWKHDALVVDKWLALQATSKLPDTLSEVKKLLQHSAFDIKNPNKVYALIGAFCSQNPAKFHVKNGEGYAFLSEIVAQLDLLNPQVAARMVTPLTNWQCYDMARQQLMKQQLEKIAQQQSLSKDVYEIINKSLNS